MDVIFPHSYEHCVVIVHIKEREDRLEEEKITSYHSPPNQNGNRKV